MSECVSDNGVRLFVLSRVDRRDGAESRAASCAYGQGRPCVAGWSRAGSMAGRCARNPLRRVHLHSLARKRASDSCRPSSTNDGVGKHYMALYL